MSLLRLMMAQEACASVALEHPEDCGCVACRASDGDPAALAEVLAMLSKEMPDAGV